MVLVAVGAVLRVLHILFFVDLGEDYYGEYGEIAKNLHAGFGYSLFHAQGGLDFESMKFDAVAKPLPSAYMPPGYVAFLFPFLSIESINVRNALILGAQIILSCLTIVQMFRFCTAALQPRVALFAAAVVALLPEFVYASCSYSPTVFYHAGVLAVFSLVQNEKRMQSLSGAVLFGFLCALVIYFRSEFAAFALLAILYIAFKAGMKSGIIALSAVVLLLLPWQIRNHFVFGEWVPLATSGGLNFFRGHNEIGIGAWGDATTNEWLAAAPRGIQFEVEQSKMFFSRGLDFALAHPLEEVKNSLTKIVHLWFINPNDERTSHALYIIPWLLMLVAAVVGFLRHALWRTQKVVLLFLAYSTLVAILFFALPRYQTMMKIALVPFAALGIETLWKHRGRKSE